MKSHFKIRTIFHGGKMTLDFRSQNYAKQEQLSKIRFEQVLAVGLNNENLIFFAIFLRDTRSMGILMVYQTLKSCFTEH